MPYKDKNSPVAIASRRRATTRYENSEHGKAARRAQRRTETSRARCARYKKTPAGVASAARYAAAHPEIGRTKTARYAAAHPDRVAANKKKTRAAHPAAHAANEARRNARKVQATPAWANHLAMQCWYEFAALKTRLTGARWEVDHIVPLRSKLVCGLHTDYNMQAITRRENTNKGNRFWPNMPSLKI